MSLHQIWMLSVALLLAVVTLGCGETSDQPNSASERDAVVAAVENLDGLIEYDEESSDRPIVGVVFFDTFWVTDANLELLKGVTSLQRLVLVGTKVTDDGLEHLKGLTSLQALNLGETQIAVLVCGIIGLVQEQVRKND